MNEDFRSITYNDLKEYTEEDLRMYIDDRTNWYEFNEDNNAWEEWSKPRKVKAWENVINGRLIQLRRMLDLLPFK